MTGYRFLFVIIVANAYLCFSDIISPFDENTSSPTFQVLWNVPTQRCAKEYGVPVNVTKYGIQENADDGWRGPLTTIFYADEMGLYPHVDDDGSIVHHGIPQKTNQTANKIRCIKKIADFIPEKNFSGFGIIDYEAWRPLWDRNWDAKTVYRNLSEQFVKKKHPGWPPEKIEAKAIVEFEKAAREYFETVISLSKSMRGGGRWGFYGFPDCYNGKGERECTERMMDDNDRLAWLFDNSTAIYPSAYLGSADNSTLNRNHVFGTVREALRVRRNPNTPVYMYSRFRYRDLSWLIEEDLKNTIAQAKSLGIEGVILWDDHNLSSNRSTCKETQSYVDSVLGPFVQNLLRNGPGNQMTGTAPRGIRGNTYNGKKESTMDNEATDSTQHIITGNDFGSVRKDEVNLHRFDYFGLLSFVRNQLIIFQSILES